jgi:ABC-type transport system involved in multi-copper enzyme maturation permease subunit
MRELILKDFYLNKRYILTQGPFLSLIAGYFAWRGNSPSAYAFFASFMYFFVGLLLYTREDKFKSIGLSLSLPATRREIMAGRYLVIWTVMISLFVLGILVAGLLPGKALAFSALVEPRTLLTALITMALCLSFFMPFFVSFGLAGLMVFLIAAQVLGIVTLMLWGRFDLIRAVLGSIGKAIAPIRSGLGPTGSAGALVFLLLVLNYASFRLSMYLFQRKDF